VIGCLISTFGPVPMFFGMNLLQFMLFIVIVSFAEALYAPMINVFTFNFTKEGREGTFLTLTAAPVYFTMALTGIVGGYLLENFYPAVEDANHKKQPEYIWMTIIGLSATSTLLLYLGRDYFNMKEEDTPSAQDASNEEEEESAASGISLRSYNSEKKMFRQSDDG
jgi:MFS family permease